tara:strand:- start:43 stop:1002 length:960 start_codon:yes stop_codon:yes gene_type:complete
MIKKLLPILILILTGCSQPEPKDINILSIDNDYYYFLDSKYSGEYFDKNNTNFYYTGEILSGKKHGTLKKYNYDDQIISQTNFINGFNTGPLIFYLEDGTSSVFDGELEMIERMGYKYKTEKYSEWEDGSDIESFIEPLSDYFYKIKIDYGKKKITNLVKISDSEENYYFGFYEPDTWIEETYNTFSINNFIIEKGNRTFSEKYRNFLDEPDLKDFKEYIERWTSYYEQSKKEDIENYGREILGDYYKEKLDELSSMSFEKYREEKNTTGYQILNDKVDKEIIEIELLEKNKFLIRTKVFRNGYQNFESEQVWRKIVSN